jgi:magnesium transporter
MSTIVSYHAGASIMDALGLNLLKLDHVRESKKDTRQQRTDCGRPLWHVGLYTYVASQLIGSTIALSMYISTLSVLLPVS